MLCQNCKTQIDGDRTYCNRICKHKAYKTRRSLIKRVNKQEREKNKENFVNAFNVSQEFKDKEEETIKANRLRRRKKYGQY